jgi:hypothetical protein
MRRGFPDSFILGAKIVVPRTPNFRILPGAPESILSKSTLRFFVLIHHPPNLSEHCQTMIKRRICFLLILLLGVLDTDAENENEKDRRIRKRGLKNRSHPKNEGGAKKKRDLTSLTGDNDDDDDDGGFFDDDHLSSTGNDMLTVTLKITNLTYKQPFGPLFVMIHNGDANPIFELGEAPSENLQILAEDADPSPMAKAYADQEGVFFSGIYKQGSPWGGGMNVFVTCPFRPEFPFITIAGMAMNTNDGFIALNGVRIVPNLVVTGPMYDAGSEINDELCTSIPGPACPSKSGNVRSKRGEGFVHVHRGFVGIGDLSADEYDWRNPAIIVEFMVPFS